MIPQPIGVVAVAVGGTVSCSSPAAAAAPVLLVANNAAAVYSIFTDCSRFSSLSF